MRFFSFCFLFFLISISSCFAAIDLRDDFFDRMKVKNETTGNPLRDVLALESTTTATAFTIKSHKITPRSLHNNVLHETYSPTYFKKRKYELQEKFDPITIDPKENSYTKAYKKIKKDHRETLLTGPQQRKLYEEYNDYWLMRALEVYANATGKDAEFIKKKVITLSFHNDPEGFSDYLVEVEGKRILAEEYDEEYWENRSKKKRSFPWNF